MPGYRGYENPKVNLALDRIGPLTERDFLDLALACLDQAGMPIYIQAKIHKVIRLWRTK